MRNQDRTAAVQLLSFNELYKANIFVCLVLNVIKCFSSKLSEENKSIIRFQIVGT